MKYVVKDAMRRRRHWYLLLIDKRFSPHWTLLRNVAAKFESRHYANLAAELFNGRVVRLVPRRKS